MNLQSKFGYCIITKTLNIALCKAGRNWTIRSLDAPADLSGQGHKNPV